MRKHIVCFGDSNTHGYCADPADCEEGGVRFNESERWTHRLAAALGKEYHVLEEGLSGRTTVFPDPLYESLDGVSYITPCLQSHADVDLLVIMLGTNDTKERFRASASCIASGMERLVRKAQTTDCWGGKKPNILIIAPPPILPCMESSEVIGHMGSGCVEKSRQLAQFYERSAQLLGVHFLDAAFCQFNELDGMHLTKKGHAQLAECLARLIPTLV